MPHSPSLSRSFSLIIFHCVFFSQFTTEPRTVIKKQDGTLWKDPEVQRKFFDDAGQALRVRTLSDWYRFSLNDVNEVGGLYR
jgi:hypothetical protein